MKRTAIIILLLAVLLCPVGGVYLQAQYQPLQIKSITCLGGLSPANAPGFMLDGNTGTVWKTTETSPQEAAVTINLAGPARVMGLRLNLSEAGFGYFAVEYNDAGEWRPFAGKSRMDGLAAGQWHVLDLSYDCAYTDQLRLRFINSGTLTHLGSVAEVEVIGETQGLFQASPLEASTLNSQQYYDINNLCDANTDSRWETSPNGSGLAEFTLTFSPSQLMMLKLYMSDQLKGMLSFEAWQNGAWLPLAGATGISSLQPGWNMLNLERISTDKVRGVFTNPVGGRLGGVSEVQLWGQSSASPVRFYESGGENLPCGSALSVKLPAVRPAADYNLLVTVYNKTGPVTLKTVRVNGTNLTPTPAFYQERAVSYFKFPINEAILTGENSIFVDTVNAGSYIVDCKIEEIRDNGMLRGWSLGSQTGICNLNDGMLLAPGTEGQDFEISFASNVSLSGISLYTGSVLNSVRLLAEDGAEIAVSQYTAGPYYQLVPSNGDVIGRRFRVVLPYNARIDEIVCWGSRINQGAPRLTVCSPVEGKICGPTEQSIEVSGLVDQADAVVTVDGQQVTRSGQRFSLALPIGSGSTSVKTITITAKNSRNEATTVRRTVILGTPPELTLDQVINPCYVTTDSFTVSGRVSYDVSTLQVNGEAVALSGLSFSRAVALFPGRNEFKVKALTPTGAFVERTLTVFREQSLAPKILAPLNGQKVCSSNITVTGIIFEQAPCVVTVNGVTATLNGKRFTAQVSLPVEGEHNITATVENTVTNVVKSTVIKVRYVKSNLLLSVSSPVLNQLFTTDMVTVKGQASDALPTVVEVNNRPVAVSSGAFQTTLVLPEGKQNLNVRAVNEAGSEKAFNIPIVVDKTGPEEFAVQIDDMRDRADQTRPTVRFSTTDTVSGVDRYELSLNGSAFTVVTSPYLLPSLSEGEHQVSVKAFDKAGWMTQTTLKFNMDFTAPADVAEFKAVPGDNKVMLSWKPNAETDVKSYVVRRTPAFESQTEKVLAADVKEYTDLEPANFKYYTYSITAVDQAGNRSNPVQARTVRPGLAELRIAPTQSATIEYENVKIGVPEGALDVTKNLAITEAKDSAALLENSKAVSVSPVYSFGELHSTTKPTGEQSNLRYDSGGVDFEKPVAVGIKVKLDGIYQYLRKENLKAYYYNTDSCNWEVIPDSVVDAKTDTVYFMTNHFSSFSVQASVAPVLSPEQISNMGVSPSKGYYENNQVGVSYASGSSTVTAKDFFLPGKGGLDLTLSRTYDSVVAQGDWGIEEKNIASTMTGFLDFGGPIASLFASLVARQIDKYLAEPAGSYGFGRGWRMNFVWVEKGENGQFVHLPGGGMKKINWVMTGSGWGGQGSGYFECHAGEHFRLEQVQVKECDLFSVSSTTGESVKVGERWKPESYTLTTKDGTKYYMDGSGRLQRIVNRLGTSKITFNYRSDKKMDHIIDSVGRKIQFEYDGKFIKSITGAGKTVSYEYNGLQELKSVNDGGIHTTTYDYEKYELTSGAQSISVITFLSALSNPIGWVNIIAALVPDQRTDDVYYLSQVTTPFKGQYRMKYTVFDGVHYASTALSYSVISYQFGRVTSFEEIGQAFHKTQRIEYKIAYTNLKPPSIYECNVYEGQRRTEMVFQRFSNDVDEEFTLLTSQCVYDMKDRQLSSHVVFYDTELEAPVKVIDETGGRNTVQEFKYDDWGNVIWTKNSHTQVETFSTYANTNSPPISKGEVSPYGDQTVNPDIHNAKTNELTLNYKDGVAVKQQNCYKYDFNANMLGMAVRHNTSWIKTTHEYDEFGNFIKKISSKGIVTKYEYSPAYEHALLTKVTLGKLTDVDGISQVNVVLCEYGYEPVTYRKRWEKDARGYVTEYEYDAVGRELMTVLPDDNDPIEYRPTTFTGPINRSGVRIDNPCKRFIYHDSDRTTTVIDPLGNRTDYIYDGFLSLMEGVKYKNGTVYSRVKVRYNNRGNITEIISPLGVANPSEEYKYKTIYHYDEMDRLWQVVYPDDNDKPDDNPTKWFLYNDASNIVTVTDENGYKTMMKKDAVDRVIEQTMGYLSAEAFVTKATYDALGNKASETDGRGNTVLYIYDDMNRLEKRIFPAVEVLNDPLGNPVTKSSELFYEYDSEGNLVRETSAMGSKVECEYDELNRKIKTKTWVTGRDGIKRLSVTKIYYDLAGNVLKMVDPNGKTVQNEYSARGWLKATIDAMGGKTSFTYDANGNKRSETDPRGNMEEATGDSYRAWYTYDELGRVTKAVLPDTTPGDLTNNPVIRFEYDLNGNCIKETKPNGQVTNYTYNGRNWLMSQSQTVNGNPLTP